MGRGRRSDRTGAVTLAAAVAAEPKPISIHPENPKYFLFRGKPLVLISASEHYGSVINRPFDYEKYLDDAADNRMTMTPHVSPVPRAADAAQSLVSVQARDSRISHALCRTGPGKAMDGEPIWDLDQWNQEYFDRLHSFLAAASRRGIVVELTLFSHTYNDAIWGAESAAGKEQQAGHRRCRMARIRFAQKSAARRAAKGVCPQSRA